MIKNNLKYNKEGLIPVIIQDYNTNEVLMLAYMNETALNKTIETKKTWFWSRSRKKLWNKGETSGNYQHVKEISYDCDKDTLLVKVIQKGWACHTGEYSCFHNFLINQVDNYKNDNIIKELVSIIKSRYIERPKGSYVSKLFNDGEDKILKKVGEEAAEVIIAAKNKNNNEINHEIADLAFHILVLMRNYSVELEDIEKELVKRKR